MYAKDPGVTFPPMPASRFKLSISIALLLIILASAFRLTAQEMTPGNPSNDRIRIGLSIGGTGFLGIVSEYQRGDWSVELTLGTITFREISVALAGKHYFSGGDLRPVVGAGFWSLAAWTDDGSGSVFIFRAPIGIDWQLRSKHALGLEVGLNRAIAVDRLDPEDDTPPSPRLVPIPGAYYRYGWNP